MKWVWIWVKKEGSLFLSSVEVELDNTGIRGGSLIHVARLRCVKIREGVNVANVCACVCVYISNVNNINYINNINYFQMKIEIN